MIHSLKAIKQLSGEAFRPTEQEIYEIRSAVDHFPYTQYYRGSNFAEPIVFNRNAGWSVQYYHNLKPSEEYVGLSEYIPTGGKRVYGYTSHNSFSPVHNFYQLIEHSPQQVAYPQHCFEPSCNTIYTKTLGVSEDDKKTQCSVNMCINESR